MSEDTKNSAPTLDSALCSLLETYYELNANVIDELHEEPSPLEFMQYVARNRPFVVRRGAESWKALRKWDADYLEDVVGDCDVNVAITPLGNADSILTADDGKLLFVKPFERTERFADLLHYIQNQSQSQSVSQDDSKTAKLPSSPIKYGQTQNDNLRNEYAALFSDVPKDIPFARIALRKTPEAINFWLGNAASVTSMHKDNYENVYVQVRGQKHFVLLPPIAAPAANEQGIRAATYILREGCAAAETDADAGAEISLDDLQVRRDEPEAEVRWALWDPEVPAQRATPYSRLVKPLFVTLDEGDMLYLPALWYHKVRQSCGEEGFCCAVNYWYDMEFAGSFWASNAFVRDAAAAATAAMANGS